METRILREIVDPVIAGLAAEGTPYHGFLYAGLMLTCDGPKVIEFNVRFGDPEAQVVIPMIADELAPSLVAAADGTLDLPPISFSAQTHVGVVLASRDYPASSPGGFPIRGLEAAHAERDVLIFHAGTAARGDEIVTAGGRVLTVVGRGPTYADAIARAYAGVSKISFDGMHFRRDIGQKALTAGLNALSLEP